MSEELISQINRTLKVACKSYFYQHKGIKNSIDSLKEFEEIPFTTKEELRRGDPFELLSADVKDLKEYHETTGTTGMPTSIWYTHNDVYKAGVRINEEGLDFVPDDIVIMRFPF